MAGTTQVLRAFPWNRGMAQYMTSPGPNPDPRAMVLACPAMRPWVTRTALGAPVDPDVNSKRYSASGAGGRHPGDGAATGPATRSP